MIIVRHELRQGRAAFLIWTAAISFLLAVCIFLFPDMKGEMNRLGETFSSMGSFTAAFGMDKLSFGTLTGYYAIECGNVLGLGGAFFASLTAVAMLCKEEKGRTAEFLLTHPISRARVVSEKLAAVLLQITAMNAVVFAVSLGSMAAVGEEIPLKEIALLHAAYFIMQLELAGICFGVSSVLRRGSVGVGLGVAIIAYFMNLIANITETAAFLKNITPFGYCDGAEIVSSGSLDAVPVAVGSALALACLAAAFAVYTRKDIS